MDRTQTRCKTRADRALRYTAMKSDDGGWRCRWDTGGVREEREEGAWGGWAWAGGEMQVMEVDLRGSMDGRGVRLCVGGERRTCGSWKY